MKRKRNLINVIVLSLVLTLIVFTVPNCAEPKLPIFETSDLILSEQEVNVGQSTTISVDVSNSGEAEGTYPVILKIDGTQTDEKSISENGFCGGFGINGNCYWLWR